VPFVSNSLHRLAVNDGIAFLTNALNGIFRALNPYTRQFLALWANEHDVRDMNRSFKLNHTRVHRPSTCLYLPLMLFAQIYALNYDGRILGQHPNNFTL
jgi:hypothetical protein